MYIFNSYKCLQTKKFKQKLTCYKQPRSFLIRKLGGFHKRIERCVSRTFSRPIMLLIETVNICNNNCIICVKRKMTRKKQIMPMDLFEKILIDYSEMGGGMLSLTPEIGEIFLDKLLAERIRLIDRFTDITDVSFTTNAVMADQWDDKDLKSILNRLKRVYISIYGLDAEEYQIMTRTSDYERAVNSIQRIVKLSEGTDKIKFGFRLLREFNSSQIEDWITRNFGKIIPYQFTNRYANWGGALNTSIPLPRSGEWIKMQKNTSKCMIPLCAMLVFVNGMVSFCACPDFNNNDEFCLGNVNTQSLADLFNSVKNQLLWSPERGLPSICSKCTFHKSINDNESLNLMFDDTIEFIGG